MSISINHINIPNASSTKEKRTLVNFGDVTISDDLVSSSSSNESNETKLYKSPVNPMVREGSRLSYSETVAVKESQQTFGKTFLYAITFLTFLVLLFSIIYESTSSIFFATSGLNEKQGGDLQAWMSTHPDNSIGLWRQCSQDNCIPLRMYCGKDDIRTSLALGGLLALASSDQANEFVNEEAQLCPLIIASRALSLLAIFTSFFALVALAIVIQKKSRFAFYFSATAIAFFALFTMVTMALMVRMRVIYDYLSILGSRYSQSGSNTTDPSIDTIYKYAGGFWLVVSTFVFSMILIALMFVESRNVLGYKPQKSNRDSVTYRNSVVSSEYSNNRVST